MASTTRPADEDFRGTSSDPATAPETGWMTPHNQLRGWQTQGLMVVMPRSPVEFLSGEMKSPSDCLAPIVTIEDGGGPQA